MWEGSSCRRSWTCPWRSSKLEEGEENKSDDGEEEEQSDKEDQGGEDEGDKGRYLRARDTGDKTELSICYIAVV